MKATSKKQSSPSIRTAVKDRGRYRAHICIFHSNKMRRRFTLVGYVAFINAVLAEGNPEIAGYYPEQVEGFASIGGETRKTVFDAEVHFADGHREWWEFKRETDAGPNREGRALDQLAAQAQAAHEEGVRYRVLTDRDFAGQEIFFDNWLVISGIIRRAHCYPKVHEIGVLKNRLNAHRDVRVGTLLEAPGVDSALMMAAVGEGLLRGEIAADLRSQFFTVNTLIHSTISGEAAP